MIVYLIAQGITDKVCQKVDLYNDQFDNQRNRPER